MKLEGNLDTAYNCLMAAKFNFTLASINKFQLNVTAYLLHEAVRHAILHILYEFSGCYSTTTDIEELISLVPNNIKYLFYTLTISAKRLTLWRNAISNNTDSSIEYYELEEVMLVVEDTLNIVKKYVDGKVDMDFIKHMDDTCEKISELFNK